MRIKRLRVCLCVQERDDCDTMLQYLTVRPVEHSSLQVPRRVRLVPIHAITIMYVLHSALSILDCAQERNHG